MINKKDIIRINQEIGESGELQNESSLDFALSIVQHKKSWIYELSYIIRSVLVDRVFKDGNKRTALALIMTYIEEKKYGYDKDGLVIIVYKIAKNSISDINRIQRMIENGIHR